MREARPLLFASAALLLCAPAMTAGCGLPSTVGDEGKRVDGYVAEPGLGDPGNSGVGDLAGPGTKKDEDDGSPDVNLELCASDSDCSLPVDACFTNRCLGGVCEIVAAAVGTPADLQVPGDCSVNLCDGLGGIVASADDSDLPEVIASDICSTLTCVLGEILEVDLPMGALCGGGVCDGAGACLECLTDLECGSGVCADGICLAPSCNDQIQNGGESDVDCGGGCSPCGSGQACAGNEDCLLGVCIVALGTTIGVCL